MGGGGDRGIGGGESRVRELWKDSVNLDYMKMTIVSNLHFDLDFYLF